LVAAKFTAQTKSVVLKYTWPYPSIDLPTMEILMKTGIIVVILSLCSLVSCTGVRQDTIPHLGSTPYLEGHNFVFRHKVSLEFPRQSSSLLFDGLLEVGGTPPSPVLRAIGLGAMGLTMFDIIIAKDILTVSAIHPSLSRLPHFKEQLTLCLMRVYSELFGTDTKLAGTDTFQLTPNLSGEKIWPQKMEFKHYDPDYTVTIKVVEVQEVELEKKQ
jgi:hypothetical protein